MDLWCPVLKVHRCLRFKPDTFSGFMTRRFCASKFTNFFSCVCTPTLRTTVGLPQLWPTVDLPFAQSKFSSIKFCNTCCRLLKKTGNKITAQKKKKCEVESLTPKKTRRHVLNKEKMVQPKKQKMNKNETVWNSTRTRTETEMKPVRKNLKTTQKLWTWNPKAIESLGPEIDKCYCQKNEVWCWHGLSTLRPKHV